MPFTWFEKYSSQYSLEFLPNWAVYQEVYWAWKLDNWKIYLFKFLRIYLLCKFFVHQCQPQNIYDVVVGRKSWPWAWQFFWSDLLMVRRKWLMLMVTVYQVGVGSHSQSSSRPSPCSRLWTLYSVRLRISRGVFETRNIITGHRRGNSFLDFSSFKIALIERHSGG